MKMIELTKENIVKHLMQKDILPTPKILKEIELIQTPEDLDDLVSKYTTKEVRIGNASILQSYEEHIKKRQISDFVMHYNNRFKTLSSILKGRDLENLTSIRRIQDMKKEDVSAIGMIFDIKETKNGHLMIDLEDKTGIIRVLISKDKKDLFEFGQNLVLDEVIAVVGRTADNTPKNSIMFANDIYFPDIPVDKIIKTSPEEGKLLFISDIHLGCKAFYKEEFESLINWIKNNKEIKYIIISGDLIDGVGNYPGQEDDLEMLSVIDQFKVFSDYLKQISKNIQIIICPGNHDAVRLAEPQPPFNNKFAQPILDMPNVIAVSSPGMVTVDKKENFPGFNILLYHGFSMPYYGDKVPEIREKGGLSKMELIMKFYLQRRHFAPTHGSSQFVPDIRSDPLVIEKVPDFLVTGHVHKVVVDTYKGVTMINASGWMRPTEYQARFGLEPDNCKAILVDLKTRDVKIIDFLKEKNQAKRKSDGNE